MRSIRLSLVVYFLVLLALGLGAVSGLAYWTTAQIVASRREATEKLLRTQHERRCYRERAKFDKNLVIQAQGLASLAHLQAQGQRWRAPMLAPLGILTAGLNPNGQVLVPFWIAEHVRGPFSLRLYRLGAVELNFNEDDLPHSDSPAVQYFQVTSEWNQVWKSRSMENFTFPITKESWDAKTLLKPTFDNLTIQAGVPVRRVTLRVPAWRFRITRSGRTDPDVRPLLLLIQAAADTRHLDADLQELRQALNEDLGHVTEESQATLAGLRNRLLAIALATFALCVAGGFWLVRFGLSPLRRLSYAVSQVSPKDFRLAFDDGHLPSELRPIMERLQQTLDQLRRAFAREKQAAADISHELRTPLAALLTTIEVTLRKPRASEEYRESLADCQAIGRQMSQLVERLLALARLDAGVDTLRPREVDAAELAEQCAALVRPLAQARGLSLSIHGAGPAPLTTDPDKLREVLTNLLHNAVEYNRPDGSIDLAVQRQNGHLQVEVRDTGIGISSEAQSHIFERFFRADPSRHAEGLHAGLGLAIVKGYVDLMGGRISVDSAEGRGTTFRLELPA